MNVDPLDSLFDKLRQGDTEAAEKLFLAYEPYLRMVVRRQLSARLRSKFDSVDVVQSVWADVLGGFRRGSWQFPDAARLRAFLVKAARNRFIDRMRQNQAALDHEQRMPESDCGEFAEWHGPRPSEVANATDVWNKLLELCPPAHHELLQLRRQGLPLAEIATRTGLHESSVRRILYELERRFTAQRKLAESSASDEPAQERP